MKTRRWIFVLAALLAAAAAPAQASGEKAKAAPKSSAATPVFIPAASVKSTDLDPGAAPGIQIADLWGDHARGAYGAFVKFPAGFLSPLHTHTHAIRIVVVSGTYTQTPEGKAQQRLGPGSYAFQPGGNYKHVSGCDKASDCVLFIESSGAFDLKPVEATAAK
jgi:quercetin dioxygenase-like cupin family protein